MCLRLFFFYCRLLYFVDMKLMKKKNNVSWKWKLNFKKCNIWGIEENTYVLARFSCLTQIMKINMVLYFNRNYCISNSFSLWLFFLLLLYLFIYFLFWPNPIFVHALFSLYFYVFSFVFFQHKIFFFCYFSLMLLLFLLLLLF